MPLLNWDTLFKEVWQPCRDLYEEMATIEQKRRNLIRRPSEPEDAYNNRVKAAYLDNHFGVALRSYAALLGSSATQRIPTKHPNQSPSQTKPHQRDRLQATLISMATISKPSFPVLTKWLCVWARLWWLWMWMGRRRTNART